jgi:Tetratricopeptide repeat
LSELGSEGRHKEEEGLQTEALEMLSKTLGPTHPDTARAMFNLGVNSENHKNHVEALKRYWEAFHIWQKHLAKGHRNVTLAEGRIQAIEKPKGKWRRIFIGLT